MSAAETIYSARMAYPDFLIRGRAQTLSLELYRNGVLAAPTQAGSTVELLNPSGTTVLAATGITVTGSIATYALLASVLPTTQNFGRGWVEDWNLVCADGVPRSFRRDAALVKHAAYPVITDGDIAGVYSDLSRQRAAAVTSFQGPIDEAWKRILGRLEQQGVFPEHVVTSWSLREVHLELTLHLICLDCFRSQGGRWGELAAGHKKEFELAWSRLKFVKDSDGDGLADSDTQRTANKGVTYVNASPSTRWRGSYGL